MLQKIASLFFMMILSLSSLFGVEPAGYKSQPLFKDSGFEKGFTVMSQQTVDGAGIPLGTLNYADSAENPEWMIAQWNSGPCLWQERAESDRYEITDGKTKFVRYNPDEKSVSMRLNAAAVYGGQAAGEEQWPHLLLEQSPLCDYPTLTEEEKAFYSCAADRLVLRLKIRMTDFKETTNPEGINAVQYLAYFYLKDVDGNNFIWFGADLFDSRGYNDTNWAADTVSGNMIYCLSTKDTYGRRSRSLFRRGEPFVSDEWVEVEIDLKPHIIKAIKRANEDNVFGEKVSVEDFYIGGTNIGFEIHGNYDCTVEIKDFNLVSYIKE